MTNEFVDDLLVEALSALEDAQSWMDDGVTEEAIAAIEEAETALARAKRAIEDFSI